MNYDDLVAVAGCDSKLYDIFHIIMERDIEKSIRKKIKELDSVVYKYSYGDDTILGSEIIIKKLYDNPNNYKISFIQTSFSNLLFKNLYINDQYGIKVISNILIDEKDYYGENEDEFLYKRTIKTVIENNGNNLEPYKLFKIIT